MTEQRHRVLLLDDEERIIRSFSAALDDEKYLFSGFTTPEDFQAAVLGDPMPAILVVDHDLSRGTDLTGYHVVREIRTQHPFGLILPIIYYSARENPMGFVNNSAKDLMFSPSAMVAKNDDDAVYVAVDRAAEALGQVLALAAHQALEQSFLTPGNINEDDFDFSDVDHE